MRRPAWVIMTYAVLLLLAVATAIPNFLPQTIRQTLPGWATGQTVSLGLDLQGGAHLLLAVNREDLARSRLQDLRQTLIAEMQDLGLKPAMIQSEGLTLSLPADAVLLGAMKDRVTQDLQPGSPSGVTVQLSDGILTLALTEAGLD
ncbi:MAG: hypothetical protein NWR54_06535, partial [Paracoccaceae bacterium]|nr:hypothetical protein [Paracoccaceae bacterium]